MPKIGKNDFVDLNATDLANIVNGPDRYISDGKIVYVESDQQIVGLSVSFVHFVPVDSRKSRSVDNSIATLAVCNVPITRCEFCEQRDY